MTTIEKSSVQQTEAAKPNILGLYLILILDYRRSEGKKNWQAESFRITWCKSVQLKTKQLVNPAS